MSVVYTEKLNTGVIPKARTGNSAIHLLEQVTHVIKNNISVKPVTSGD